MANQDEHWSGFLGSFQTPAFEECIKRTVSAYCIDAGLVKVVSEGFPSAIRNSMVARFTAAFEKVVKRSKKAQTAISECNEDNRIRRFWLQKMLKSASQTALQNKKCLTIQTFNARDIWNGSISGNKQEMVLSC